MPPDGGPFELLRLLLGEQVEIGERGLERRRVPKLAERHLGRPQVALLYCADEAPVCRALGSHRRSGGRLAESIRVLDVVPFEEEEGSQFVGLLQVEAA
jgi:hypothetical protein